MVAEGLRGWAGVWWAHAGAMAWQVGLLVVVVWVIDRLLAARVRAVVRHAVWLLVPVKLMLPPALSLPGSLAAWWWGGPAVSATVPVTSRVEVGEVSNGEAELYGLFTGAGAGTETSPGRGRVANPVIPAAAFVVWLAGVGVLTVVAVRRWRRTRGWVARSRRGEPWLMALLEGAKATLGVRREMSLLLVEGLPSPAVFGLRRPRILLPAELVASLAPAQLREVLLHEVAHVKRHDLGSSYVQLLLQIVYWWHPLVWIALARLRQAAEEATDEAVVVASESGPESYASTLVQVARTALRGPISIGWGLLGIVEPRGALAFRVRRLLEAPVPTTARMGWRGAVVWVGVALALLPMARPTARAKAGAESAPRAVGPAEPSVTTPPTAPAGGAGMTNGGAVGAPSRARSSGPAATLTKVRGSQVIRERLESIRLPRVRFDDVPLLEVVKWLKEEVRRRDPNGRGVNFFVNPILNAVPTSAIDPATGEPTNGPVPPPVELSQVRIRLVPALDDVTAMGAVEAVANASPVPISATLEDYAVVFSQGARAQLVTRVFRLSVPTFEERLRKAAGAVGASTNVQALVRAWLGGFGLELEPPSAVFFNNQTGLLMVRAPIEGIELVEGAVEVLNAPLPMVQLETVVVEFPENRLGSLGLEGAVQRPEDEGAQGAAVLHPRRRGEILAACGQDPRCRVLKLTRVTTLSHREAMIVADRGSEGSPGGVVLGASVRVLPRLRADGRAIEVTALAVVREFVLDPARLEAEASRPAAEHALSSRIEVLDGESLVAVTPPVPAGGPGGQAMARRFAVIVTPVQIDPAGNRIHAEP